MAGLGLAILMSLALDVRVVIGLLRFEAAPQADASILVVWETASELNTVAFSLYRATTEAGPWDTPIDRQPARGDAVTGASYLYRDTQVTPGIRYYYLLEELTQAGAGQRFGPVSARIGLPPEPTSTPTPTATGTQQTSTPTPTLTSTVTKRSLFLPVILRQCFPK